MMCFSFLVASDICLLVVLPISVVKIAKSFAKSE